MLQTRRARNMQQSQAGLFVRVLAVVATPLLNELG